MNVTSNSTEDLQSTSLRTALLVSGTFLAVICPLTVLSNALILVAIYKDPFKTFRTPTTCFLVGLALVDLINGLVPEPMVTTCYFRLYNNEPLSVCEKTFYAAGMVAAITTNASFFIILAFTFAQYIAVAFPIKYKRVISVPKSVTCVAAILSYATLFEISRIAGVSHEVIAKIDLHLHSTFSLFFTIVTYLLLQRAFRKRMRERRLTLSTTNTAQSEMSAERRESCPRKPKPTREQLVEKNFVRLNLLLIVILFVCSQPSAIMWYVYLYADEDTKNSQSMLKARIIADNTLYLKFLLDPFVFAWRLPKYRKALKKVLAREG